MLSGLGENGQDQATTLVVGSPLPARTFFNQGDVVIKVKRGHKVVLAHCPTHMHALNSSDWKSTSKVRSGFSLPPKGRQKTNQEYSPVLPCCLLLYGAAATSLLERMIVINWWWNLSKKERSDATNDLKKVFLNHKTSAVLMPKYDPSNPRFIGIFDSIELREEHAATTRCHSIVSQPKKRKGRDGFPVSNAHMRDVNVQSAEGAAQLAVLKMNHRTRRVEENQDTVTGRSEAFLAAVSNTYTPNKGNSNCDLRLVPKVSLYGRDRPGAVLLMDRIAAGLRANADNIDLSNVSSIVLNLHDPSMKRRKNGTFRHGDSKKT